MMRSFLRRQRLGCQCTQFDIAKKKFNTIAVTKFPQKLFSTKWIHEFIPKVKICTITPRLNQFLLKIPVLRNIFNTTIYEKFRQRIMNFKKLPRRAQLKIISLILFYLWCIYEWYDFSMRMIPWYNIITPIKVRVWYNFGEPLFARVIYNPISRLKFIWTTFFFDEWLFNYEGIYNYTIFMEFLDEKYITQSQSSSLDNVF